MVTTSDPMFRLPKNFSADSLPLPMPFGHRRCTLRQLRPDDASRLLYFFKSHTAETIRLRYGYAGYDMSPEKAAQLANVDQEKDAALVIMEREGRANRIVAVGRYSLDPDGKTAEMAFVVRENRRGLGMASVLLEALISIAQTRGIEALRAQTFFDNFPMLGIFIHHGACVTPIPGTEGVEVRVEIPRTKKSGLKKWRTGLRSAFRKFRREKKPAAEQPPKAPEDKN